MNRFAVVVALSVVVGCSSAYQIPDSPTAPAVSTSAARLNLTAATRSDTRLDVFAEVLTVTGQPVKDQRVTFATNTGTLTTTTVTTDAAGFARSIAAFNGPAIISATADCADCAKTISVLGAPAPVVLPLTVQLSGDTVTLGTASMLAIAVSGGTITSMQWDFGDGYRPATMGSSVSHVYGSAGTYTASVTVRDTSGRTASASATARVNPAPVPQTPGLIATAACVAGKVNLATACNVTVTEGAVVRTGEITSVDWVWADGESNSVAVPTASHIYRTVGSYVVYVTITLSDGRIVRASVSVTVTT